MTDKLIKYGLSILLIAYIYGCEGYDRSGVEENIYINKNSISMFVGDQIQLKASPTEADYNWTSEDPTVATVNNGLVEATGEGATNIVASNGIVHTKVLVNVTIRIPLTDITLSEDTVEMFPNDKKNIFVTLVPDNANDVPKSSWISENPAVATVTDGGEIFAVAAGTTNIVYRCGDLEKTILVSVITTRPFNGPHSLSAKEPCTIMAADFDFGGEGNAFHDNDSGDNSGQGGNYRRQGGDTQSDAVDVEGFGQNVGWTDAGEWLLYTVEVQDAGGYLAEVQTSVPGSGSFQLEVDGVKVTNTINIIDTGGWGNFQWNPTPGIAIDFTAGKHTVKYYFEGGHNFKAMRFTKK